ncbi:MAG: helix-turn-helix transcriptional regulator [Nitrospiria bacterium]
MEKELLKVDEVAKKLSVSKWTVYRWVEEGRLKATKLGPGVLRIFKDSVDELINTKTVDIFSQE